MVQTPPAMALGFDDTSRTHGDALARAFAESPPSNLAGDPPARFSPVKHAVSNGDSHPVRVPEALEEAMRLQSLERFARRKETEARTMSPLRKAEVRESRARSVCGTGVAERKTLGSASKLKIDAVVRAGAQRPETFGRRRAGAPGVRDCADSIQGVHHKSGRFEKPGSALDFARNDHDGGAVSRALGSANAAALAPPAPALRADRGWSEAGNENRPSMRAPREGHAAGSPHARSRAVGESASYLSLPSSLASRRLSIIAASSGLIGELTKDDAPACADTPPPGFGGEVDRVSSESFFVGEGRSSPTLPMLARRRRCKSGTVAGAAGLGGVGRASDGDTETLAGDDAP